MTDFDLILPRVKTTMVFVLFVKMCVIGEAYRIDTVVCSGLETEGWLVRMRAKKSPPHTQTQRETADRDLHTTYPSRGSGYTDQLNTVEERRGGSQAASLYIHTHTGFTYTVYAHTHFSRMPFDVHTTHFTHMNLRTLRRRAYVHELFQGRAESIK